MFERIRAIIIENIIIIILEFNKLEPTSSIMREGKPQEDGSTLLSGVPQTKEITGEGVGGEGAPRLRIWCPDSN